MPNLDHSPPDEFVSQVRDAFVHLYDLAHLERHELTLLAASQGTAQSVGRALRRILIDRVELLRPSETLPRSDRSWRPYIILVQRYIDGYSPEETMADLNISLRQMQRDHHKGLWAVASLLWQIQQEMNQSVPTDSTGTIQQEVDSLGVHFESIDLSVLVDEIMIPCRALALSRGTDLLVHPSVQALCVQADPALVRPGLLSLLSALISTEPRRLDISWSIQEDGAVLRLALEPQPLIDGPACQQALDRIDAARPLLRAQGGDILVDTHHNHLHVVRLRFPRAPGGRILIVDDNERVLQLFERYLSSEGISSVGVGGVAEARQVLAHECPSLIILDVMMRDVDGWQFLQELRSNAELDDVPIIICSVLDEPELTEALGAQHLLKKPVTRQQMLAAVQRVLAGYSRGGVPVAMR